MAAARSTIAGVGRDKAAAVVTDGGTLAAHASLAAREYGIPAWWEPVMPPPACPPVSW
jgi:signal transduction protein with GAF and PtsI domain